MPERSRRMTVAADPAGLEAVQVWSRVTGSKAEFRNLTSITREPDGRGVWRFDRTGPASAGVIAKRCRRSEARVEQMVHEEVLPRLSVSAPEFFGSWDDGDLTWLFFEAVDGQRFSPERRELRVLAARWLAALHLGARDLSLANKFPKRGPAFYLQVLRTARQNIRKSLSNPALSPEDLAVLERALAELHRLEGEWEGVEDFSLGMPETLVHGDFRPKNILVRRSGLVEELVAIDWETAGWGIPAPDLAPSRHTHRHQNYDLVVYAKLMGREWPGVDEALTTRMSGLGLVFRRILAMAWASESLPFPHLAKPIGQIHWYVSEILASRMNGAWPP